MHDREPDVSVVIPARNEAATIGWILERAREVLPASSEIIVVDDGSTDGTAQVVRAAALRDVLIVPIVRPVNGGKGTALRDGVARSRGRFVIFQDADLELDPIVYPALLGPLLRGEAGAVYGSRFLAGRGAAPWLTYVANTVLTAAANLLFGLRLTDMESGHKAFLGEVIRALPLRASAYEIEPEITAMLAKRMIRIREVATAYRPRTRKEGKRIGVRDAWAAVWTLVRCRVLR